MARIWLVEDDRNLANLTRTALEKNGYIVDVYFEAAGLLEEAKKHKPDLILMDVILPDVSGPEAVKALKKESSLRGIPVIFLTALLSAEESEMGLTVENIQYRTLGKPYEIKQLLELVESALQ